MKIYTYFGEFYWFNVFILGYLDNYLNTYSTETIGILTLPDYAQILEQYFKNNDKIRILGKNEKIYISYRRGHHGNPNTGNLENFKLILKYGNIDINSKLLFTNSWLEQTKFYLEWIKENKLNKYGDKINTTYNIEPLPDNSLKSKFSLYEYLLKKYPNKPWIKHINKTENTLFDLNNDLFNKENLHTKHYQITRIIKHEPINNNFIHIFPRNRTGHWNNGHISHISYKNWVKICKLLKKLYPDRKICCHGHMESFQEDLNNYIDIKVINIKESINLFYKSDILISPASGLVELAVNCGIKNIIYIYENNLGMSKNGIRDRTGTNNPFNANRKYININNDWNNFKKCCNQLI